jgi:DNA-binding NtrC family response regulator
MTGLLFIDDEEGVRRSLERALKNEPYTVYTAEDGETGIRLFQENLSKISIVISDYKMPGLDGLETLARIGALKPEVTRILLSDHALLSL